MAPGSSQGLSFQQCGESVFPKVDEGPCNEVLQEAWESLEQEVSGPAWPEAPVQAIGECAAVTRGGGQGRPADQGLAGVAPGKGVARGRAGRLPASQGDSRWAGRVSTGREAAPRAARRRVDNKAFICVISTNQLRGFPGASVILVKKTA